MPGGLPCSQPQGAGFPLPLLKSNESTSESNHTSELFQLETHKQCDDEEVFWASHEALPR